MTTRAGVRIGARLRAQRRSKRLTLDQVAGAAGLTAGFVSRLERDDTSPSVASLVAVCRVLGLRVGELFDPPDTAVVRADEGRDINFGGQGAHEQLLTPTQNHLEVIHGRIEPGGSGGPELYALDCDMEFVYVLAGRLDVELDGETVRLGTGDAMSFPGRTPHTWRNASARRGCEVLWTLAPAP